MNNESGMKIIDLDRIRQGLPDRAVVTLKHNTKPPTSVYINVFVNGPSLSPSDTKMCFEWQRDIVGEALSEFYTEEDGRHWIIYLKRIPIEFINAKDEDINNYVGFEIVKDGSLDTPQTNTK